LAAAPSYFVVNGEEGRCGRFTDRHLMEGDPQRVLEGLLIAAYGAGTKRAIIHINGSARFSFDRLARALAKAQAAGLIGDRILGSAFSFHVELRRGPRAFVRGEEQMLLRSIEGQQALPETTPPWPPGSRLWGKPAVISNVATLAALPPMIAEDSGRTRILGVSGPVNRPGIVEVEAGITLRELLFDVADGLRDRRPCEGVLVAGPSDVLLSPGSFDATVESLDAFLAGADGLIVIPAGEAPAASAPGG